MASGKYPASNAGSVNGPVSSTDNAIVRWDGTTGNTLQDSNVTIDDSDNIAGAANVSATGATLSGVTASRALTTDGSSNIAASATTATELGYLSGVTSALQTQIDGKEPTISLTANRAVASDGSGGLAASATTDTELGYLSGVTSAIQTQLDAKLNLSGGTMTGVLVLSGDGSAPLNPVSKQQLDAAIDGVQRKASVAAATTANITLSGEQTIDGILTSASRVLVKDQTDQTENGIYLSDAGAWTRTSDANSSSELTHAIVSVQAGTANGNTAWEQVTDAPSIGVDNIVWNQAYGAGTYTADGLGIELTGGQFSLELDGATLSKSASGLRVAALTASRAVVTDGSGNISAATTTSTEIGYVNGVTSAIQTQLDAKLTDPMTTNGDIITQSGGSPARVGIGTDGQILTVVSGAPAWNDYNGAINYIINGGFDFWKRGTSATPAAGQYLADRWSIAAGVNSTHDRVSFTQEPGSDYALRFARTGTAAEVEAIYRMEQRDAIRLEGKTVTVSFWAAVTSGTSDVFIRVGNASAGVDDFSTVSLGSAQNLGTPADALYHQYSYTFAWTSSMASNGFQMNIGNPTGASITFQLTQVQLTEGSAILPFKRYGEHIGEELNACERYYQRNFTNHGLGVAVSASTAAFRVGLRTEMRAAPTIAQATGSSFTNAVEELTVAFRTPTGIANTASTINSIQYELNGMSGMTTFNPTAMVVDVIEAVAEL